MIVCDDNDIVSQGADRRSEPFVSELAPPVKLPSIPTAELEQLEQNIRQRGSLHGVLYTNVPRLIQYVERDPHRRAQVQQCNFVPTLMTCVRTAPDSDLRCQVVKLLREIVRGIDHYPSGINNDHFLDILIPLTEFPECAVDILEILQELTQFNQGQSASVATQLHHFLARVIAVIQHQEVLIPALRVLCNLCQDKYRCRAVLNVQIFDAFKQAAANRLLAHFQKQKFPDGASNNDGFSLMWKFSMKSENDRQAMLREIIQTCECYCSEVLSEFSDVMLEWSKFMELCTHDSDVESEAIRLGFIENSQVIIRYGVVESLGTLLKALKNVSVKGNDSHNQQIVNFGLIEVILERFKLFELCASINDPTRVTEVDRTNVTTIFELIFNVLKKLPNRREVCSPYTNIVESLLKRNFMQLEKLQRAPLLKKTKLPAIILELYRLSRWCPNFRSMIDTNDKENTAFSATDRSDL